MSNPVRTGRPPGTAVVAAEPPAQTAAALRSETVKALTTPRARALIEPMLAHGVRLERICSEVYFAVQANPQLEKCEPESLVMAVAQCVKWDLTIGEKVHLVPFNVKVKVMENGREKEKWVNRAQAIRDYKGDIELVVRTGAAHFITAHNVYEHEHFQYELGTNPRVDHRPIMSPAKRGPLVGSYAVARLWRGGLAVVVMSREEIDAVRMKLSKSWKERFDKGENRMVALTLEDIPWYGPKTCVHRVTKMLPTSPRLLEVLRTLETEMAEEGDAPAPAEQPSEPQPHANALASQAPATADQAPALATVDQNVLIAQLLEAADLDDEQRMKLAEIAGDEGFTAVEAEQMIGELRLLIPPAAEEAEAQ